MVNSYHASSSDESEGGESFAPSQNNFLTGSVSSLTSQIPSISPVKVNDSYHRFLHEIPSSNPSVPRTAPCFVLSPNTQENITTSPPIQDQFTPSTTFLFPFRVLSPPSLNRLSESPNLTPNGLKYKWIGEEREPTNQIINVMGDNSKSTELSPLAINLDKVKFVTSESEDIPSTKQIQPRVKLSFGIDRILENHKSNPEKLDEDHALNLKFNERQPLSMFCRNPHFQHQHSRFHLGSPCSDCYFLSRFSYKYTSGPITPTQILGQSNRNPSFPSSWNPSRSGYDNINSSFILSPVPVRGTEDMNQVIPSILSCNSVPTTSSTPITPGNGRRKRSWSRAVFSNLQRKGLEKRFQIQKYITKPDRRQLAATLGLTDAQVQITSSRTEDFVTKNNQRMKTIGAWPNHSTP